jgi:dihydrofolate synthase/folylpolyglutamate synthase
MNFQEAVNYLLSLGRELAAPTQAATAKFNLENISVLARRLGHPETRYPAVHIAGTNGKGSTAAFLESILREAGYRTGLYTSPHLERINERIRVDGEPIADASFADVFSRIQEIIEKELASGSLRAHPTFFECVTAIAFLYFAESGVDFAVFETGLGGRLDSTNIITPQVSIITRIDFDHENFLGHSLAEIASEKAGIIKPAVPVVVAPQREEARKVVALRARQLHSPLLEVPSAYEVESLRMEEGRVRALVKAKGETKGINVDPQLPGRFQLENALNALAAAQLLKSQGHRLADGVIELGIATAVWPGRIEKIRSHPDVYLDGAHNPAAAQALAEFIKENFPGRRITLIFGALRDKAVDEISGVLFPLAAKVIFTEAGGSRAISAAQLADIAGHYAASSETIPDSHLALKTALAGAGPQDIVFVTGSLYLVGQMRSLAQNTSELGQEPEPI